MLKGWFGQDTTVDVTDILIDSAVPNNAENILNVVIAQIGKKADIAAKLEDMILESFFDIQRFEMFFQLCPGFLSEST